MQGHFDLTMFNTPGLTQELIEAVRREGGDPAVEDRLRKFAKDGEWKTDNLIYQVTPGFLFYRALNGPLPYGPGGVYWSFSELHVISLMTSSSEPTYNGEIWYSSYLTWENLADSAGIGTGKSKRFINDCIVTPDFKVDASGREAIYGKFKWLYLPGEGTSSVIRSIGIHGSEYTDVNSTQWVRCGRVRIKDSGGNPVTISKAATRSLLVEYTFTMPTL